MRSSQTAHLDVPAAPGLVPPRQVDAVQAEHALRQRRLEPLLQARVLAVLICTRIKGIRLNEYYRAIMWPVAVLSLCRIDSGSQVCLFF